VKRLKEKLDKLKARKMKFEEEFKSMVISSLKTISSRTIRSV
jgi:hypothetical protein